MWLLVVLDIPLLHSTHTLGWLQEREHTKSVGGAVELLALFANPKIKKLPTLDLGQVLTLSLTYSPPRPGTNPKPEVHST